MEEKKCHYIQFMKFKNCETKIRSNLIQLNIRFVSHSVKHEYTEVKSSGGSASLLAVLSSHPYFWRCCFPSILLLLGGGAFSLSLFGWWCFSPPHMCVCCLPCPLFGGAFAHLPFWVMLSSPSFFGELLSLIFLFEY